MKRVQHLIACTIVCAIITLFLALAMPTRADAMPVKWRNTPTTTQAGVTYRIHDGMHAAAVVKTSGARVNIPAEVRYRGKWYRVRAIWPDALKGAKKVTIHADLESCESGRLWSKKVQVSVTRAGMYRWLKRTGANVKRIHCAGCK